MKLLGRYDAFRLAEYQLGNSSLLGTNCLRDYSPCLNDNTFCNSVFIQTVYEFLEGNRMVSVVEQFDTGKVRARIERNKEILKGDNRKSRLFDRDMKEFCRSGDKLFSFFLDQAGSRTVYFGSMLWFAQNYFGRFRHEYVNKYHTYMREIEQCSKDENYNL